MTALFTYPLLRRVLAACALLLLQGAAQGAESGASSASELAARYPKGSIDTPETADRALAEISRARKEINARFAQEEQACLPKFFVTACVDKARDKQRQDLSLLRPIELESNHFKRQARAEKHDADLAEKQRQAQARQIEAERAPPVQPRAEKPAPAPRNARSGAQTVEERVAEHEARMQAQQAREQAEAPERAERAAAYERKVQASRKRQEEVARRKAEKEAKRRAREEAGKSATPAVGRP